MMAESSYRDSKVIATSKHFVNIVAHRETGHGTREVQIGREKQKWCKEYPGIPCDVHVKGESALRSVKNIEATPTTVFCDPSGAEIDRKVGAMSGSELNKMMEKVLAKVPGEKVPLPMWTGAKKLIVDGDAAFEKGEYKKAIEAYQKVAKLRPKSLKALAEDPLQRVEAKGNELLDDAKGKIDSEKEEARKLLKKISDEFKPFDCAKEAAELLKSLK